MAKGNSSKALRAEEYLVSPDDRPGWVRGSEQQPQIGQEIYCAGGVGAVVSVHGKTGDGSRLIQIQLEEVKAPFFAAASNVLVPPPA